MEPVGDLAVAEEPPKKTMNDTTGALPRLVARLSFEERKMARELELLFGCAPIDPRIKNYSQIAELLMPELVRHLLCYYTERVLANEGVLAQIKEYSANILRCIDVWLDLIPGLDAVDYECATKVQQDKRTLIVDLIVFLRNAG